MKLEHLSKNENSMKSGQEYKYLMKLEQESQNNDSMKLRQIFKKRSIKNMKFKICSSLVARNTCSSTFFVFFCTIL